MTLWGAGRRRAAADNALAAYRQWGRESSAARITYQAWRGATASDEQHAFNAYMAALDREEGAAVLYARRLRRAQTVAETAPALQRAHCHSGFGA